jgi:hypothetical protein
MPSCHRSCCGARPRFLGNQPGREQRRLARIGPTVDAVIGSCRLATQTDRDRPRRFGDRHGRMFSLHTTSGMPRPGTAGRHEHRPNPFPRSLVQRLAPDDAIRCRGRCELLVGMADVELRCRIISRSLSGAVTSVSSSAPTPVDIDGSILGRPYRRKAGLNKTSWDEASLLIRTHSAESL